MQDKSNILVTVGVPDGRGNRYTEDQLTALAEAFPEKLQYRDGILSSVDPIPDDAARFRWEASLEFQRDELQRKKEKKDFDENLWSKMMTNTVEPTKNGFKLYLVHPQWGGYGVPAEVEFERCTGDMGRGPGCFELSCYHDGDFPTTEIMFSRHCCSAEQFVRFGLDVLEAQLQHQLDDSGEPVQLDDPDRSQLAGFAERIKKILEN